MILVNATLLQATIDAQTTLGHPQVEWWEYLVWLAILGLIVYAAHRYDIYAAKHHIKERMIRGMRKFQMK